MNSFIQGVVLGVVFMLGYKILINYMGL